MTGAFAIDLSQTENYTGIPGPPVISHNAVLVFPLDLSDRVRVASIMGPGTAFEAQTKSICAESTTADLARTESDISRNVQAVESSGGPLPALGARQVRTVALTMPYRIPQDDFVRVADGLCVAVRPSGARDFSLVVGRTAATHDDSAEVATAVLPVGQTGIDAVAVLFETTSAVSKIVIDIQ